MPAVRLSRLARAAVAREQISVYAAYALSLGADAATRPILRIPGVQIDVHPTRSFRHETLEEQSAENRASQAGGRYIIQIGDLAGEFVVIGAPQRHRPER